MKIKELKSMIENNYLDDDAEIMFSGVRNGVKHHGYEVWSTEDSLGRESMHISIATEGDNDYAVVERDVQVELWLKKADQLVIDINTEKGMYRDWTHPNKKELDDLIDDIEFDYDINKKGVSQYDFDRLTEFKEKLKSLKYKETA
jgi:hypothetical protein|tara:strand:+ start:81 stop:515 length:435 start_codon:yes stop_codon:yes gene_type:complete